MGRNKLNINVGDIFGNLKIICESEKDRNMRIFNVVCVKCKKNKHIRLNSLIHSKNGCQCTQVRIKSKHSVIENRFRSTYYNMMYRCNNSNCVNYKDYGGRGIKCKWETFEEFYNDMFPTYKDGLSIDRINNDGNYCKENCRWADKITQNNNRRNNISLQKTNIFI